MTFGKGQLEAAAERHPAVPLIRAVKKIHALRADRVLTTEDARGGRRLRIPRQTGPDQWWRAVGVPVRAEGRGYTLVAAVNDTNAFKAIIEQAKSALDEKSKSKKKAA